MKRNLFNKRGEEIEKNEYVFRVEYDDPFITKSDILRAWHEASGRRVNPTKYRYTVTNLKNNQEITDTPPRITGSDIDYTGEKQLKIVISEL